MGLSAAAGAGAKTSSMKPLGPNFVFNGFGGSERVDPFAENSDDSDVIEIDPKASETESTVPSTKLSIHNRLKTGGLRNFKLTK